MSAMSTNATSATTERPVTRRGRLSAVPWLTVVPLAVLMAYAGGIWVVVLRSAIGSIERTQEPFVTTWLLESTLVLPLFVLAVVGALALATRWFGPGLRKPKAVVAGALLIVAAGTLLGIAVLAASSAYDYHLQSAEVEMMNSMGTMGSTASVAASNQAGLALQVRSVVLGSGALLVTNLVLVGWVVALRGGRLEVNKTRK